MRKYVSISFVFVVLFVLLGCATVKQAKDNYQACLEDPVCMAKMEIAHNWTERSLFPVVNSVVPSPFSNPIVEGLGWMASLLTGVFVGRRTKK